VTLLGSDEKVEFTQGEGALEIKAPAKAPCSEAVCYKITFKD